MAIKSEEALSYVGITAKDLEGFEDIEAFKESFDGNWVKIAEAHKNDKIASAIFGKHAGQIATRAKNALKKYGVEIGEAELKEAKLYDLVDMVAKAGDEFHGKSVNDIKAQLEAAQGGGKEVKELQEKYAKALKDVEEHKGLSADLKTKLEAKDKEFAERERTTKKNDLWKKAIDGAPFRKDLDPFARKGFEAEVRSKYDIAFEDDGTPYAVGADGHRVKDTTKSNSFLGLDDIVKNEVVTNKLHEANPHGNKPAAVKTTITEPAAPVTTPPGQRVRTVHPAAVVQ